MQEKCPGPAQIVRRKEIRTVNGHVLKGRHKGCIQPGDTVIPGHPGKKGAA